MDHKVVEFRNHLRALLQNSLSEINGDKYFPDVDFRPKYGEVCSK